LPKAGRPDPNGCRHVLDAPAATRLPLDELARFWDALAGEDAIKGYQAVRALTLAHGHRIVNGQSGYMTPLFNFLAGGQSPLN
jgi:hypothetical protein